MLTSSPSYHQAGRDQGEDLRHARGNGTDDVEAVEWRRCLSPTALNGISLIGEHLLAATDAGAAQIQGDRWDAGKVGKRNAQSVPANEQY